METVSDFTWALLLLTLAGSGYVYFVYGALKGGRRILLSAIEQAASGEDLVMISDFYDLDGREVNEAFLVKALRFAHELTASDWRGIWRAADPGTTLELEAAKRLKIA